MKSKHNGLLENAAKNTHAVVVRLVLEEKGHRKVLDIPWARPVLALVPGSRRAGPAKIGRVVGTDEVRVAKPGEVLAATGSGPGGVAPFPPPAGAPVLVERTILSSVVVWVGAGSDRHMAMVAPQEIVSNPYWFQGWFPRATACICETAQ